ncbi:MAG: MFS transporter, partial [Anaerolineales bacterium]
PFVLKILLGLVSDSVNLFGFGHRKPYIALGLIGQIVMMLIAPNISVTNGLGAFALAAFIASVSMALYDTCTDGMALDTTPENERGIVQGAMVGARAAGILVMLVAGGTIAEKFGWKQVFYSISLITLLPLAVLLSSGLKESKEMMGQRSPFVWSAFKSFRSGTVVLLVLMGFIYSISLDGVLTFLSDYLREVMEISLGNIGLLVALSMVGRIVGALSNGWVTDRIGYKVSLYVAIGLTSIGCLGLSLELGVGWIGVFGFVFGLAYGYYNAVYAAVAMKMSHAAIAASMFAIFMMFLNLGTVGGQVVGGMITDQFGFAAMVIVFGIINLLNIPLANLVFRQEPQPTLAGD